MGASWTAVVLVAAFHWPTALGTTPTRAPVPGPTAKVTHRVNLNTATIPELRTLPGVGELLAQRIVAARPYRELTDLLRVKGIDRKRFQRIAPRVVL